MTQFIELTGRTEADAIVQALAQLGLERDDIRVEVLERAKTGFLGFGSKPAKIRVSYEEKTETVNLYADLKAEEASAVKTPEAPQTLEATQAIDAQKLATMLDQASSTVSSPAQPILEEEEPSKEETSEEEEVKGEESSSSTVPSFLASSPIPVENTTPQAESVEKIEEVEPDSQKVEQETVPETEEEKVEEPVLETPPPSSHSSESSPESPKEQETPVEKPQSNEEPVKKLSKKERETLTPAEQEAMTKEINRFLEGLLVHLKVEATPRVTYKGLNVEVRLEGEGLATLIGKRGETLDSIQQITGYVVMRTCKKRVKLFLDAENYRAKREETLIKLANKVAGEAVKNKRNVPLEPMNAYERHIIHEALSEHPHVFTYSTGSEPNRCTVVAVQGRKTSYKKNKNSKR